MKNRIVFRDSAGRTLSLEDLKAFTGRATFEIGDDSEVPQEARALHDQGRTAGSEGSYDRALSLFAEAAAMAPRWPFPVYDSAFSYLRMGDSTRALECFRRTLDLAPGGFYMAVTAVQALEREEVGSLPRGTFFAYSHLEWIDDSETKEALVRQLTAAAPKFAPAWNALAGLLTDDTARLRAIEQGLAADPDPDTRGVLLVNRALILFNQGKHEEATAILGVLALDPASSPASATQAKMAFALLLQHGGHTER